MDTLTTNSAPQSPAPALTPSGITVSPTLCEKIQTSCDDEDEKRNICKQYKMATQQFQILVNPHSATTTTHEDIHLASPTKTQTRGGMGLMSDESCEEEHKHDKMMMMMNNTTSYDDLNNNTSGTKHTASFTSDHPEQSGMSMSNVRETVEDDMSSQDGNAEAPRIILSPQQGHITTTSTADLKESCIITVPDHAALQQHQDVVQQLLQANTPLNLQELVFCISHLLQHGRSQADLPVVERCLQRYQPESTPIPQPPQQHAQEQSMLDSETIHMPAQHQLDYQPFMFVDPTTNYTRNLIATDGLHWTLLLLCFNPRSQSPIHSHSNAECFVRVVENCVVEHRYAHPDYTNNSVPVPKKLQQELQELNANGTPKCGHCQKCLSQVKLVETQQAMSCAGGVTFMNDSLGLHKLVNPTDELTVTLHLYFPPYSSCKIFLNESMVATISNICYHSVRGKVTEY